MKESGLKLLPLRELHLEAASVQIDWEEVESTLRKKASATGQFVTEAAVESVRRNRGSAQRSHRAPLSPAVPPASTWLCAKRSIFTQTSGQSKISPE